MRRPPTAVLATLVVPAALVVPVGSATPARADETVIGLSPDGVHWSGSLARPLFDPAVRWVPGDVRTARFWVRNQHPDAGDLTVDLERVRRAELLDSGWLDVSARAGAAPWTAVHDGGGLAELLDADDLASGDPVRVEVRVRMGRDAPNGTMVLSTDLDLRVTIVDADAVAPAVGALPDTGTAVPPWLPPLALGLVATGGWLVLRRRRDEPAGSLRTS